LASPVGAADKPLIEVPLGDAPVRGSAVAPVTMVEFIDFQ
jgi:protein-disulfide isomerase